MCKDRDGKVGLRVRSVDKGVFVALVTKGSPSAMGGLRFGDQILQINGMFLCVVSIKNPFLIYICNKIVLKLI